MATSNGTLDDGADPGEEDAYDASGALKFIVVTVGVYSLMGVISLLLVRILRRAKFRLYRHRGILYVLVCGVFCLGIRESLLVTAPRRTRNRKVGSSNPGRSGGRIFFSRVNFVC